MDTIGEREREKERKRLRERKRVESLTSWLSKGIVKGFKS